MDHWLKKKLKIFDVGAFYMNIIYEHKKNCSKKGNPETINLFDE